MDRNERKGASVLILSKRYLTYKSYFVAWSCACFHWRTNSPDPHYTRGIVLIKIVRKTFQLLGIFQNVMLFVMTTRPWSGLNHFQMRRYFNIKWAGHF